MWLWFILAIFPTYWILFSLISLYFVKKAIRKYKHYPLIEADSKYYPFLRQDFGKWNQKQLIKGCFTRSPAHFPVVVFYLIIYTFLATFHKYIKFPTYGMVNWFRSFFGRIVMNLSFEIVEQFDSRQKITTPIVISNHTSQFDIIYTGSHLELMSFVSKIQVKRLPIINNLAEFLGTIYVDRNDPDSRNRTKLNILQRVNQFNNNPTNTKPLLLFPQGTTTNGKGLIQFKNGAFQPLCPVTIISLNYQCNDFNPGMEEVYAPDYQFLMSSVRPKITVKKDIITPKQNESVESFRQRCRKRMGEMTGYGIYEVDVKDYLQLQKKRKQKKRQILEQKSN